jgi:hypothetical protein
MANAMLTGRTVSRREDFPPSWRFPVARAQGPWQAPGPRGLASRRSRDTPINRQGTPGPVRADGDAP